jgi:hypothetical protein
MTLFNLKVVYSYFRHRLLWHQMSWYTFTANANNSLLLYQKNTYGVESSYESCTYLKVPEDNSSVCKYIMSNVRLSLIFLKHHAMNTYGVVEV